MYGVCRGSQDIAQYVGKLKLNGIQCCDTSFFHLLFQVLLNFVVVLLDPHLFAILRKALRLMNSTTPPTHI